MKSPDVVPLVGFIDQVPEIEGAKLSILVLGEEGDAGFVFPAESTATPALTEIVKSVSAEEQLVIVTILFVVPDPVMATEQPVESPPSVISPEVRLILEAPVKSTVYSV